MMQLTTKLKVLKVGKTCAACKQKIDRDNYAYQATILRDKVKEVVYIHDSRACLAGLRVKLKLARPDFHSSRVGIS
jgi:hypothetical protein